MWLAPALHGLCDTCVMLLNKLSLWYCSLALLLQIREDDFLKCRYQCDCLMDCDIV